MTLFTNHKLKGIKMQWKVWKPVSFYLSAALVLSTMAAAQEQVVDDDFKTTVSKPAYTNGGPTVSIDEAHDNFHTANGQYRPFAELLKNDGYSVKPLTGKFNPENLAGIGVLVIANALPADTVNLAKPAFTAEECNAVRKWVREGGSLLLIADHEPFGSAACQLASRFGVAMGKGWAFERTDSGVISTTLTFSREKGTLGSHPVIQGRSADEEIGSVRTFTGQSLGLPAGAAVLLLLSQSAREAATQDDLKDEKAAAKDNSALQVGYGSHSTPAGGRAQGVAMEYGKGRVVVLGEAGFLSAQMIRWPDGREMRFGMNVPGNDNKQFALNVMHWLSRLIK